jgi:hypothetical protein
MGAPVPVADLPDEHKFVPHEDVPGSVFDNPTAGERLKRIGKAIAAPAAGMATAVGGAEVGGAVGGIPGAIAGGVIGGAAQPFVEAGTQHAVTGQPYQGPSAGDVAKSAIINGIFTGVGKLGEAAVKFGKTEDAVRNELTKLPAAERTMGKVKQIREALKMQASGAAAETAKATAQDLRNRDFWKAHGLDDHQIDSVMENPTLRDQLAQSIEAGGRYKQAFQSTLDATRQDFHNRYQPLLPDVPVESKTLGEQMVSMAQGADSPKLKKWLTEEGQKLSTGPDPLQGLIPADELATMTPKQRQGYLDALGKGKSGADRLSSKATNRPQAAPVAEPAITRTPEQLQGVRTDLRKQLSGNASNTDLRIRGQIHDQLTKALQEPMSPEQRGAFNGLDAEYGRFQDVIDKLDPRSEKYGQQVANALFDPMVKDPEMATNFIRMAEEADKVHGSSSIMGNLREAFLSKALERTHVPGQPFEELKALRKLQDQWGGNKASRVVMGEMFGKDSPLADPATFTKVVEAANDPAPLKLASKNPQVIRSILSSPYFQGAIAYNMIAMAAGNKGGSPIMGIMNPKSPEQFAEALVGLGLGSVGIGLAIRTGNASLSRALVKTINNPSAPNVARYLTEFLGSGASAMATGSHMPTPEETAAGAPANP